MITCRFSTTTILGICSIVVLTVLGFRLGAVRAQTVTVTDFGAIPNDGVDDAPAIQQALDAVASLGTIMIPAGTFDLGTSAGGVEFYPDNTTPI